MFNINCIRKFNITRKLCCKIEFDRNYLFAILYKEMKKLQLCNMFVNNHNNYLFNVNKMHFMLQSLCLNRKKIIAQKQTNCSRTSAKIFADDTILFEFKK